MSINFPTEYGLGTRPSEYLSNLSAPLNDFEGLFHTASTDKEVGLGSTWDIPKLSRFNLDSSNYLFAVLTLLLFIANRTEFMEFAQISD